MSFRRAVAVLVSGLVLFSGVPVAAIAPPPALAATLAADDEPAPKMILLLDSSGSMRERTGGGQTRIDAARSALRKVIDGLPEETEVGLRVFGATVENETDPGACEDSQLVVDPATGNRDALRSAVGDYKPFGNTPIPAGLRGAAKDLGDEGVRSIVLVTDGISTCSPDPCKVAADLVKGGIDLHIDVVGMSLDPAARSKLKCIAENGNGNYYDADSAADIESRLIRVAERAVRPFRIIGTPIQGGSSEDDATPVTVGSYKDRIQGSEPLYYSFERTVPGTMLRVAAFAQGRKDISNSLSVEITNPDGERCSLGLVTLFLSAASVIGTEGRAGKAGGDCEDLGRYVIKVEPGRSSRTLPFGLRVSEEPALVDPGFTPPSGSVKVTRPQVSGTPQAVSGAASFDTATEIGHGRWSSNIVPGEALLYRLPLDFGQSARIAVNFPKASPALQELMGLAGADARITMYDPMYGQLGYPAGARFSDLVGMQIRTAKPVSLLTATQPISRVSEKQTSTFDGNGDFTTAGYYYLAVAVDRESYTAEIPFTIDVEVVGDPQPGPTYADGATWSVADGLTSGTASPSPSDEPSSSEGPSSDPSDAAGTDSGSGLGAVGGILAGLLGLVVIAGALVLWRRSRAG